MNELQYPKRREDLRVTDQQLSGENLYIVVDEKRNAYYSFPEIEFSIFWSLDGETPLETVKERIEEMVPDIEIPLEFLDLFVQDLGKKQLLVGTELAQDGKPAKPAKPSAIKSLFYLRIFSINPDKMLEKLVHPLAFIYTAAFTWIGLFLVVWSLSFSYIHKYEWLSQMRFMFHGWGLLFLYVSFLGVAFVHETGHSLTCRYFGGKVKEMGFMLIYFEPAFYANVTDAYVFRDKKHRMAVGLAGLYFQFIFGAFLTVIWYFSIPGSTLSLFCAAIMAINGLTAFWNLNPLIKLDGYYVLNDFLEVVNLRSRSFGYFGLYIQKLLLGLPETEEKLQAVPQRLRRIYFWYGALGMFYTSFFLGLLLLFLIRLVARKFAGFGLLLLAGGIAWMFWNWYKNAAPGWASFFRKINQDAELRMRLKSRGQIIGAVVAALLLIGMIPVRGSFNGPCVVRPAVQRALAPLESGVISRVYKKEGDDIGKGEVFASLDDFDVRRDLASLLLEENFEKQSLTSMKADYGTSLVQAQGAFARAQLAMQAHDLLSSDNLSQSKNAMEEAYARYLKSRTTYDRLHADLTGLKSGNPPPDIAQIEASQKDAGSQLSLAQSDWTRYQKLQKEDLVSQREAEEKKADFQSAQSRYQALSDKLASAKRDLVQNEATAEQDYLAAGKAYQASKEAFDQTSKQVSDIDPQQLREQVENSRSTFSFTRDKASQIKAAVDKLAEVSAGIKTDREKLNRMELRSPISGRIMTPHVNEMEGRMVEKGQPVAWVYEPGPMIFEIRVGELDIPDLPLENEGSVVVRLMALPGHSFRGKILRVVPDSLTTAAGQAYLVDVQIDRGTANLLPGMQGTGKIYGRLEPIIWNLFRRPVKYILYKLWGLF